MRSLIFAVLFLCACSPVANGQDVWPALPATGFVSGRAATQDDVNAGNAGFAIGNGAGSSLAVQIPQYAYFNDSGVKVPVVLIQAEAAQGKQLAAAKKVDGTVVVGFLSDFTLLGTRPPSNNSFKPKPLRGSA
jgi:hypothetical protein